MNCILIPSLEHIVLAKIGGTLWNQEDIKGVIKKFCTSFSHEELIKGWPQIECRVKEKVPLIPLPELLKEKLLGVIKPMGVQVSRWLEYYGKTFSNINLPSEFCWTPQGTVDEKKTAELLIKDKTIDITRRYQISCYYCLENDVVKLWNEVPVEWKKTYYNENEPMNTENPDFVDIWTYNIKGELSKVKPKFPLGYSTYQYACNMGACEGNKSFMEYFLQKLPLYEKNVIVSIADGAAQRRMSSPSLYSDIVCILIAHMDKEQQLEIFQNCHSKILVCFLDWPWQSFFVEIANHLWTFIGATKYCFVLKSIVKKLTDGFKDFSYQKLFTEYWQRSPNALKRSFLKDILSASYLLSRLFKVKDLKNIKLILNDATITQKQHIISCECGQDTCKNLIYSEEWNLLKFFIQKCLSSRDEMIKLKVDLRKSISRRTFEKMKDKWDKFLSLLDDITYESSKRKSMEDDNSEAKRLDTQL